MIVLEDAGRLHVENEILQAGILFHFLAELVREGGVTGLSLDGNLSGGLIVGGNAHVSRGQTLKQVQQNFDRVEMGIDCRRKNFPMVGGGAHEGGASIVAGDGSVKLSFTDLQIDQLEESERQDADVNCPNQHQAFAPFSSARATQS